MAAAALPVSRSGRTIDKVLLGVAAHAGATMRAGFRYKLNIERKGRGNLVTDVDRRVEQEIVATLEREFPAFGVIAEEGVRRDPDSLYTWIIDPLDGTGNYAVGIGHFCINIALMRVDAVVFGMTYDPIRRDFFMAEEGRGTMVNGARSSAGAAPEIAEGSIAFDIPYEDDLMGPTMDIARALWPVQRLRVMGSAALGLAYVAAGWTDLYYHFSWRPWDTAAGLLLIREAGGQVLDMHGKEATPFSRSYIAGGRPHLVREFSERTTGLRP